MFAHPATRPGVGLLQHGATSSTRCLRGRAAQTAGGVAPAVGELAAFRGRRDKASPEASPWSAGEEVKEAQVAEGMATSLDLPAPALAAEQGPSGTVAQAVAESRAAFKPLVVLLIGQNAEGDAVQRALLSQAGEEHLASCILLRLEDNLGDADPAQFRDAKNFRAFCPVLALPAVVMVSPAGAALATLTGPQLSDPSALRQALSAANAQFKQQQTAFLAAQAFAALAQRAAATSAAPVGPAASQQAHQQAPAPAAATAAPEVEGPPPSVQPQAAMSVEEPERAAPTTSAASQPPRPSTLPDADSHPPSTLPEVEMDVDGEELLPLEELPSLGPGSGSDGGDGSAEEDKGSELAAARVAGPAGEGDMEMAEVGAESAAGQEEPTAAAPTQEQEQQEQPQAQPCTMQLRFTDGSVLRANFSPFDPLAAVFAAIDTHRAAAPTAPPPYVLVLPQPQASRQFGPSEEDSTLAALGLSTRCSLAVVPNPRGHKPTGPPLLPAPTPAAVQAAAQREQEPGEGGPQPAAAGAAGPEEQPGAREAAASPAVQVEGEQRPVKLHVRLPQGPPMVLDFPPDATLADVFASVDAHIGASTGVATGTGSNGPSAAEPYVLAAPHLGRQFGPGEGGSSLAELGIEPRTLLTLVFSQAGHRPVLPQVPTAVAAAEAAAAAPTMAAALPGAQEQRAAGVPESKGGTGATGPSQRAVQRAKQQQEPPPQPAVPAVITLQFKQPDGGTLRGDFAPDATLQQVFHYVDTHRRDDGGAYTLVQPYPRRQFGAGAAGASGSNGGGPHGGSSAREREMGQSLLELGLGQRSQLIMEPVGGAVHAGRSSGGGGGWSVGGLLSYLNPLAYLRPQHSEPSMQQGQLARQPQPSVPAEESLDSGEGAGASGTGRGGTRKRGLGQMGSGSKVHTLGREEEARGQPKGRDGGDHNAYWNGNSTEFGGDDPEDKGGK